MISILPLEFIRSRVHAPLPMVTLRESPPIVPVAVIGNSLVMWPKEVCAVTLYPALAGMRTAIWEKEVFRLMSLQPEDEVAVTSMAPF